MIQTPTKSYLTLYKEPIEFRDTQLKVFWTADEINLEKDVHDILTNCTEAEKHGIFTTLKLFTHYEMLAGEEYWTNRFMHMFPRHEFTSMASVFGMFELAVHAPFYNKINVLLNAHDDSFYTNYISNPVLRGRMEFINNIISSDDDLLSIAGFSLVEGVILYSNFAFLKHFQSLGKNKLLNVVRGINFSVRDENIHAMAGAWCFKALQEEMKLSTWQKEKLEKKLNQLVTMLYDHECAIIDMIFEKGDIEGINAAQLKQFVVSRINLCLEQLGMNPWLEFSEENPIADWFYKGINNYHMNDFFSGAGREYVRSWKEQDFVW